MGLDSRNYFDNDDIYGSSWNPKKNDPLSISTKLAIVFGVSFTIGALAPELVKFGSLSREAILSGRLWTPFTFAFTLNPRSILGVIISCYLMYAFGNMCERTMGRREYGLFLAAVIAFSAVAHLIVTGTPTIGPVHLIEAVFVWLALTSPRMNISLILFTAPLGPVVMIFAAYALFSALQTWRGLLGMMQGGTPATEIPGAYLGDTFPSLLGAILFAFMYQRLGWNLTQLVGDRLDPILDFRPGSFDFARWSRDRQRRPKLKVVADTESQPRRPARASGGLSESDAAEEVDRILQKISQQGEASLTKKERRFLKEESQRLRKRQ